MTFAEYTDNHKFRKEIQKKKKELVREIMKVVKPHMWQSGYVKGALFSNQGNLKIFIFPKDKRGEMRYYKLKGFTASNDGFIGFTEENAIAVDAHGGGLSTARLIDLSIENLFILHYWVINKYNWELKKVKNWKQFS